MSKRTGMDAQQIELIIEAGLLSSEGPVSTRKLQALFKPDEKVGVAEIKKALSGLEQHWQRRAVELASTASGWQLRTARGHSERIQRFLETSPPRLSRPMMEVLAIVAYHQPVTRGRIESIRGVSTSAGQLATLEEYGWVEVSGHQESPGRPLLYVTTDRLLDDLGLEDLSDLPALDSFDIDEQAPGQQGAYSNESQGDSGQTESSKQPV